MKVLNLDALIPSSVTVYAGREDYATRNGKPAPVYDPDRPNCFFEGSVSGLMRLENGKMVPYGDQPKLNLPGPYAPIRPVATPEMRVNGKPLTSPWFVCSIGVADWIATSIGLPILSSEQSPLTVTGCPDGVDAYFVRIRGIYWINLGEALATKAPYGEGSPGVWLANDVNPRVFWQPDERVNAKTAPTPYRALAANERLDGGPIGNPVVIVDDAPATGGGITQDVQAQLDRIEAGIADIRLWMSLR